MTETDVRPAKLSAARGIICRYFTHYGNAAVPGVCDQEATLKLLCQPNIFVCDHHALVISLRFPSLGTVEQRFVPR